MLRSACKATHSTQDIDLILADFAEFLNAEQLSYLAMKYLQSSSHQKPEVASLKNRLYYSNQQLQEVF